MHRIYMTTYTVFAAIALAPGLETREVPARARSGSTNASSASEASDMQKNGGGSYAHVSGLKLYHRAHGVGEPLVLLHGGVGGIEMLPPVLRELAKARRVIAVDLQGHGRTADIDRPLHYELLAEDVAALLKHLNIKKADIAGYSLGAGVAIRMAIEHSELVNKLVIISTAFKRDGWYPEVLSAMEKLGPGAAKGMKQSPLAALYPDVNWEVLFTKLADLMKRDYDWSKEARAINAPTMLVFADADSVSPAHIVEFYGLLGGGKKDAGLDGSARPTAQLAILPGCTHYNILSSPALVTAVNAFLDAPVRLGS